MVSRRNSFSNREALAKTLAEDVARKLSSAITHRGTALLAVSGGTTPSLFFEHLSRQPITWEKVIVTLVDERQVSEDSPRSNARLVRERLLINNAKAARFVPLYENPKVKDLPDFDACILGMGNDGHTASFFPGGDTLSEALNLRTATAVIEMRAPGAGEPRLTFTLPRIVASRFVALHIEGEEKHSVLARAEAGKDVKDMPVRAVLAAAEVDLYWCP
jgi:6-phosphogluconolactonase